jgi:hypothetical protein
VGIRYQRKKKWFSGKVMKNASRCTYLVLTCARIRFVHADHLKANTVLDPIQNPVIPIPIRNPENLEENTKEEPSEFRGKPMNSEPKTAELDPANIQQKFPSDSPGTFSQTSNRTLVSPPLLNRVLSLGDQTG